MSNSPEALQATVDRMEALASLSEAMSAAVTDEELYLTVARFMPRVLGVPRASIAIAEADEPTFRVTSLQGDGGGVLLPPGSKMMLMGTAVGEAIDNDKIVSTHEYAKDAFGDWRHLASMGLENFVIAPLSIRGEVLGSLNLGSPAQRPFTETDIHFTKQVALALATHLKLRQAG